MSNDDSFDLDGDIGTNEPVTIGKRDLAALRKAARAGETAAKEAADAKRSLAFMQAGVDPADKRLSYFAKAYDGEMTADAIRNAAVEAGFLQAQQQSQGDPLQQQSQQFSYQGPPPDELGAMQRMNSITQGNSSGNSQDAAFRQALSLAKTPDEVMSVVSRFNLPMPGVG